MISSGRIFFYMQARCCANFGVFCFQGIFAAIIFGSDLTSYIYIICGVEKASATMIHDFSVIVNFITILLFSILHIIEISLTLS
jgi:hypothetical protein